MDKENMKKQSVPTEPPKVVAMVRTSPDALTYVPRDGDAAPPRYGLGLWSRRGDGTWVFVPMGGQWVAVTGELLEAVGLTRSATRMLRNLARAGMIRLRVVAPKVLQVELGSLMAHLERGEADVDRFEQGTADRRAYQLGHAAEKPKREEDASESE